MGKCDNQPNERGARQGRGVMRGGGTAKMGGEYAHGQQVAPADKRRRRLRTGAGGVNGVVGSTVGGRDSCKRERMAPAKRRRRTCGKNELTKNMIHRSKT